jgi:hypothetical protein|tara:strand:+ start:4590 stop:5399 length:810 start_codon:yes stop_codon:yes gene_type:complete
MAYRDLKGIESEINIVVPSSANGATAVASGSWAAAKAGTNIASSGSNIVDIASFVAGGVYFCGRAHLMFDIPENLSRLDHNPQLKVFPYTTHYTASILATSNAVTPKDPIGGTDSSILGKTLFTNTQLGAGALLSAASGILTKDAYNVIQLNQLATFYCLTQGKFIVSLVNATHDYANSAPTGVQAAGTTYTQLRPAGHANGPVLVLKKPWFIDSEGTEFQVDTDFVIKANDVSVNQRNRRVAQLPFGTALKGPASMRLRNDIYQVTRS